LKEALMAAATKEGKERLVKASAEAVAKKFGKDHAKKYAAWRIGSGLAQEAVRLPFASGGRVAAGFTRDAAMDGVNLSVGEQGIVAMMDREGRKGNWQRFADATVDSLIENVSERSGAYIAKLVPKAARDAIGKMSQQAKGKLLSAALVKSLVAANPNKPVGQIGKFLKGANIGGTFEEMGEERIGSLLRDIYKGTTTGEWELTLPTAEDLLVELVAFSVPNAARGVQTNMHFSKLDKSLRASDSEFTARLDSLYQSPEAEASRITEKIGTPVEADDLTNATALAGQFEESDDVKAADRLSLDLMERSEKALASGDLEKASRLRQRALQVNRSKGDLLDGEVLRAVGASKEIAGIRDFAMQTRAQVEAMPDADPGKKQALAQVEKMEREADLAGALVKIAQGREGVLTAAEQEAIKPVKGTKPAVVQENGAFIITDDGIARLRNVAPTAATYIKDGETVRRQKLLSQSTAASQQTPPASSQAAGAPVVGGSSPQAGAAPTAQSGAGVAQGGVTAPPAATPPAPTSTEANDVALASEPLSSIVAKFPPGPDRTKAMAERRKAAVRLADSLKSGDTIIDSDGNEWEVVGTVTNGKGFVKGGGEAMDFATMLTAEVAQDASGNKIELPAGTIRRAPAPTSTNAPAPTTQGQPAKPAPATKPPESSPTSSKPATKPASDKPKTAREWRNDTRKSLVDKIRDPKTKAKVARVVDAVGDALEKRGNPPPGGIVTTDQKGGSGVSYNPDTKAIEVNVRLLNSQVNDEKAGALDDAKLADWMDRIASEEMTHFATVEAISFDEAAAAWKKLGKSKAGKQLQADALRAYNAAYEQAGKAAPKLDDAASYYELIRMAIQNTEFRQRITESAFAEPGIKADLLAFLQRIADILTQRIAALPKAARAALEGDLAKVRAAMDALGIKTDSGKPAPAEAVVGTQQSSDTGKPAAKPEKAAAGTSNIKGDSNLTLVKLRDGRLVRIRTKELNEGKGEIVRAFTPEGKPIKGDAGAIPRAQIVTGTTAPPTESAPSGTLPINPNHKFIRKGKNSSGEPIVVYADSVGVQYELRDVDVAAQKGFTDLPIGTVIDGGMAQYLTIVGRVPVQNGPGLEKHSPSDIIYSVKDPAGRPMTTAATRIKSVLQQPAPIDAAANEAATSPTNDKPEPTDAQKKAGNYAMGHVTIGGMDITIENPAGSIRSGTDKDGEKWEVTMKSHYGYMKGTKGKDGDHIDIFIEEGTPGDYSGPVYVVNQNNQDGEFDEHKAVMGPSITSADKARAAYLANYSPGWNGAGSIAEFSSVQAFKDWATERQRRAPAKTPEAAEKKPTKAGLAKPTIDPGKHYLFDTKAGDVATRGTSGNIFIIGHFSKMKDAEAVRDEMSKEMGVGGIVVLEPWLRKSNREGGKPVSMWSVFIPNVDQEFVDAFNAAKAADTETNATPPVNATIFKVGDRVTWTSGNEDLSGIIRSVSSDGTASINTDQIAFAGGVPIGRIETVQMSRLKMWEEDTPTDNTPSKSPQSAQQNNQPSTGEQQKPAVSEAEQKAADAMRENLKGLFSAPRPVASPFFSQLAETVRAKMPASATPEMVRGIITNPQNRIKQEELKWSGVLPWLDQQGGKVSKEALLAYLENEGAVELREVAMSSNPTPEQVRAATEADQGFPLDSFQEEGLQAFATGEITDPMQLGETYGLSMPSGSDTTKYSQYQLPGGANYREVVLAMPPPTRNDDLKGWKVKRVKDEQWAIINPQGQTEDFAFSEAEAISAAKDFADGMTVSGESPASTYTSRHFSNVPNYVAHMRLNERTDATGAPGLFVEELQSDRHQAGRNKGYAEKPNTDGWTAEKLVDGIYRVRDNAGEQVGDERGTSPQEAIEAASATTARLDAIVDKKIPDAPFRKDWPLALFKRALRDAVATGKEWIGWTTGETQAERFDLSKHIDTITAAKTNKGDWQLEIVPHGGGRMDTQFVSEDKLADTVGKDLAEKIIADGGGKMYSGLDLKVGGEGMKGFYDAILPKEIGKYVKQWGATVEKDSVVTEAARPSGLVTLTPGQDTGRNAITAPIWRVNITPAMREGVQRGQPLFSAPRPAAEWRDEDIPEDRIPGIMQTTKLVIDAGVRTPEDFAAFMERTFPGGGSRPFVSGIWQIMGGMRKELRTATIPDWAGIYAGIDGTAEMSDDTADETQSADSQGTPPELPSDARRPAGAADGLGDGESGEASTGSGGSKGGRRPRGSGTPTGVGDSNDGSGNQGDQNQSGEQGDAASGGSGTIGADGADSERGGAGGDLVEPERRPARSNYFLSDPESIVGGGPKARFNKNKRALEVLEAVQSEGRDPTDEELDILAAYTGWGSLAQELFQGGSYDRHAGPEEWKDESMWLREYLGRDAWMSAFDSILNAHYTDPPTVTAMWDMIRRAGFNGGRVLEPSEGIGNFWSLMPRDLMDRSQLTGIEMDPTTAAIAKMLHPRINHRVMPYQQSQTSDNFYDVVVGNWPFSSTDKPADPRFDHLQAPVHDYFFVKALSQTRPGGLVIGITSSSTMDKKNSRVRKYLAARGELVAAFRLPTGAFGKYAGTKVVTDIIILKKREQALTEDAGGQGWIESVKDPSGRDFNINEYFVANPQNVLGDLEFGHGTTFNRAGMIVNRRPDYEQVLPQLFNRVPENVMTPWNPIGRERIIQNTTSERRQGAVVESNDGLYVVDGESLIPLQDKAKWEIKDAKKLEKRKKEARALIKMRGALTDLLDSYRRNEAGDTQREALKKAYDEFTKDHGKLNDSYMLDRFRRAGDQDAINILALVDYDPNTKKETPRALMLRNTMRRNELDAKGSIADAYALHRSETLDFDAEKVASLAGPEVTADQVIDFLNERNLVYNLPDGRWIPGELYLAGNVRQKLREAMAAKEEGVDGMDKNIEALKAIVPADVPYHQITVQMGAAWVPVSDYHNFIKETLGGRDQDIQVVKAMSGYNVRISDQTADSADARNTWNVVDEMGRSRIHPSRIFQAAMNGTELSIKDTVEDANGNRREVLNEVLTARAMELRDRIRNQFELWLWRDEDRIARLQVNYNEMKNAVVNPTFDGSHLRLPGLALTIGNRGDAFEFRQHQLNAVWRGILTQQGVYAHEVGTGKTFTMAGLAIEGRRLGSHRKPIIFAHNANAASVAADFRLAYPGAKVLFVDNLSPSTKELTLRQIATDDWDAVIVPHSLVDRFGLKPESVRALAQPQLDRIEAEFWEEMDELGLSADDIDLDNPRALNALLNRQQGSSTAKDLANQRRRIMTRIDQQIAKFSGPGTVFFEDMGIDAVIVDEAHIFKKIALATRKTIKGLNKDESGKGFQLGLLTDWLKTQTGGKGVHLFTGTPVTNTLNEVFNMMRFAMDREMSQSGVDSFDDFYNDYAAGYSDTEPTSGGTYEEVLRLRGFINIPELARMASQAFDVVRADEMPEFTPRESREGFTENPIGRPQKQVRPVVIQPTPVATRLKTWIRQRFFYYRGLDKRVRMFLKKAGGDQPVMMDADGKAGALDPRLVSMTAEDDPNSKVNFAIRNIMEHYNEHESATQMVFVERGAGDYTEAEVAVRDVDGMPIYTNDGVKLTQKERRAQFNLLRDMVEKLVAQGVKPEEIAVFHNMALLPLPDGRDDVLLKVRRVKDAAAKEEIAKEMREGKVRIAFGGTETMGTGVNAQTWMRAMHHLDVPYMPGELEQRNGRGWRQGNKWNTVFEYRYTVEGSHDAKMWSTLLNKVKFIERFIGMLQGKNLVRTLEGEGADAAEDADGISMADFEQMFSTAAGDPRLILRSSLSKKVDRLKQGRSVHLQFLEQTRRKVDSLENREIPNMEASLATLDRGTELFGELAGKPFQITLRDQEYTERKDFDEAMKRLPRYTDRKQIGQYGPFAIWVRPGIGTEFYELTGAEGFKVEFASPSISSIEGTLRALKKRAENVRAQIDEARQSIVRARSEMEKPYGRQDELESAETSLARLEREIVLSPWPAPAWFRVGAPQGSLIYLREKGELVAYDIEAHRWDENDYWAMVMRGGELVPVPYKELLDATGARLFEDQEFTPPPAAPPVQADGNQGQFPGIEQGLDSEFGSRILIDRQTGQSSSSPKFRTPYATVPDGFYDRPAGNGPVPSTVPEMIEFIAITMENGNREKASQWIFQAPGDNPSSAFANDWKIQPRGKPSMYAGETLWDAFSTMASEYDEFGRKVMRALEFLTRWQRGERTLDNDREAGAIIEDRQPTGEMLLDVPRRVRGFARRRAQLRRIIANLERRLDDPEVQAGRSFHFGKTQERLDEITKELEVTEALMIQNPDAPLQSAPRLGISDPDFIEALDFLNEQLPSETEREDLLNRAGFNWNRTFTQDELRQAASGVRFGLRSEYDERLDRQTHEGWNAEAVEMLRSNRQGVIRDLVATAAAGEAIINPVQVKASQLLLPSLTMRALAAGDRQAMRDAEALTWAYDIAGTETARGLAARWQPHKTPEELHRELIAKAIFTPSKADRDRAAKAPTPTGKRRRIAELEAEIERVKAEAIASERNILQQASDMLNQANRSANTMTAEMRKELSRIRRETTQELKTLREQLQNLQDQKDSLQILAEANDKRLKQIEEAFKEMGVTFHDLFVSKEAVAALRTSSMVKNVLSQFNEKERLVTKMRMEAKTDRHIAKKLNISKTAVEAINERFNVAFRASAREWVKRGFSAADLDGSVDIATLIDEKGNLLSAARPTLTDAEIDAKVDEIFRVVVPSEEARATGALRRIPSGPTEGEYGFDLSRPEHAAMLMRAIQRLDATGMDMVYEYWINGLLSGTATHIANIAGNTGNAAWEYAVQRPVEMFVNSIITRDAAGAQFDEVKSMAKYLGQAASTAMRYARTVWQTEVSLFDPQWLNKPVTIGTTSGDKGQVQRFAIKGTKGRIIRLPSRALAFADEFAKHLFGMLEAAAQAHRLAKAEGLRGAEFDARVDRLVKTPGSPAWLAAVDKAHAITFTSELPAPLQKMQDVLHERAKTPWGAAIKTFLRFLFPFVRTPYNIFATGLRKTPLGGLRMIGKGIAAYRGNEPFFDSYPKAAMAADIAEQLLAWTATMMLIGVAEGDPDDDEKTLLITGSRSLADNRGEDQMLSRMKGGETTILWKGKPILHYGRYEPFATMITTVVDAARNLKAMGQGRSTKEAFDQTWRGFLNQARSKTFLQGLEGLMSMVEGHKNLTDSAVKALAQGVVPNLIRQSVRAMDDYARDSRNAPWYYQAFPAGGLAEPLYDLYGRPIEKAGGPISRMLVSVPQKQQPIVPADRAMSRFNLENPNDAYYPQQPTKSMFRYKVPVPGLDAKGRPKFEYKDMTPQQAAAFRRRAGQQFTAATSTIFPFGAGTATPAQMAAIETARNNVQRETKATMFPGRAPAMPPRKAPTLAELFGQRLRQ
jgi:N12 class adenine-specific DNA methylase